MLQTYNIITFSIFPGPSEPKDLNFFFHSFINKLAILETHSIQEAYDADSKKSFTLHAYTMLVTGDIKVIEKVISMTDTNSQRSCPYMQNSWSHCSIQLWKETLQLLLTYNARC